MISHVVLLSLTKRPIGRDSVGIVGIIVVQSTRGVHVVLVVAVANVRCYYSTEPKIVTNKLLDESHLILVGI